MPIAMQYGSGNYAASQSGNNGGGATVYVTETGTANGWTYRKWSDGTIDAWQTLKFTASHYTTVSGFYGYQKANISTPFTMSDADYVVGLTWKIGNGFSVTGGILSPSTTKFNAYSLASASGSQAIELRMYLHGNV